MFCVTADVLERRWARLDDELPPGRIDYLMLTRSDLIELRMRFGDNAELAALLDKFLTRVNDGSVDLMPMWYSSDPMRDEVVRAGKIAIVCPTVAPNGYRQVYTDAGPQAWLPPELVAQLEVTEKFDPVTPTYVVESVFGDYSLSLLPETEFKSKFTRPA